MVRAQAGFFYWLRWLTLAGLVMLLGGCANVLSAQVTRYQQWPSDAQDARYQIQASSAQENNLQFQNYADAVRAALGPTGLVESTAGHPPRFIVHLDYGTRSAQEWRQRAVDPYFYGGFYGPRPYRFHHFGGFWGPGPIVETVPVMVTHLELTVRIDDQSQGGREVYRATAVTTGGQDQLAMAMPYLARAAFAQFPGRNGQVIEVRFPLSDR